MRFARRDVIDRFLDKIEIGDDCWLWTASKFWDGYGKFYKDDKSCRAHRASYELFVGPIPDGLVIDHLCRNPICVRPDHLEPVTVRENTHRSPVASPPRLAARSHCNYGHEFNAENTYVRATNSARVCRTCGRLRAARARARRQTTTAGLSGNI